MRNSYQILRKYLTTLLVLVTCLGSASAFAQQAPAVIDPEQTDPGYAARKQQLILTQPAPTTAQRGIQPPGTPLPECFEPLDKTTYNPVPRNDDGSLGPINLGFTFFLFGTPHTSVFINTNGNITFDQPLRTFSASGFPMATPMIAPFWADEDTRTPATGDRGQIWYRLYNDRLVVTWDSVGYFNRKVDKKNNFQLTIYANAGGTLTQDVVFAYGDMQWTTGDASSGRNGFGGIPANAGINEGGTGGHFTQIGRFDADGSAHVDNTSSSGIDFLDYKCFGFRVFDPGNQPPAVQGLPLSGSIAVNQGQTVTLAPQFTGPEPSQNVAVTVNLGSLCNATAPVGTGSNPVVNFSVTGSACNVGPHTVTFTATDNGVPVASSTFTLTVVVNPGFTGAVWDGEVSTDYLLPQNWVSNQQPQPADSILIPSAVPRFPVLSGAATAGDFNVATGASLTVAAGGHLTLNGYLHTDGPVTGDGMVSLTGASRQNIGGSSSLSIGTLEVGSAGALQLGSLAVRKALSLSGVLTTAGHTCTLLSNASGTAMVVNLGSGRVIGNATVQRFLSPTLNAGLGYRHLAAPVSGQTMGSLAGALFTPVINTAYNTVGNSAVPFPNMFSFDQSRIISSANTGATDFDRGWLCPASTTVAMADAKGYTVNMSATAPLNGPVVMSFTGALHNGTFNSGALPRGNQTHSGWHLLGNPYPAPLDWDMAFAGAAGLDNAVYVFKSSSRYGGSYDSYVNGFGTARYIGVGQGFFVRTTTPGGSGQLNLTNTARVTNYRSPSFNRQAADPRPQLRLELFTATGQTDAVYVYFEQGATAGFDPRFDAYKLAGGEPLSLSTGTGAETLSISGLPLLKPAGATVPLQVGLPGAGTFTLRAGSLLNFATNTSVLLEDRQTGQRQDLRLSPDYTFQASRYDAAATRFVLHFAQARALATSATELPADAVSLWPNPASRALTVSVAALPASTDALQLSVMNALGQVVLLQEVPVQGSTATAQLDISNLKTGVYTVRGTTAGQCFTRSLVVQ